MPKGFTDVQMIQIRQSLQNAALVRIKTTGIKKTTVENIALSAGISKGAFYKFYSSKEALFFEILELHEKRIQDMFLHLMDNIQNDSLSEFKNAIRTVVYSKEMKEYLFIMGKEDIKFVLSILNPRITQTHIKKDYAFIAELASRLERKGIHLKASPDIILAYTQALFCLFYDYELIGSKYFKRVIDSFVDTIVCAAING